FESVVGDLAICRGPTCGLQSSGSSINPAQAGKAGRADAAARTSRWADLARTPWRSGCGNCQAAAEIPGALSALLPGGQEPRESGQGTWLAEELAGQA